MGERRRHRRRQAAWVGGWVWAVAFGLGGCAAAKMSATEPSAKADMAAPDANASPAPRKDAPEERPQDRAQPQTPDAPPPPDDPRAQVALERAKIEAQAAALWGAQRLDGPPTDTQPLESGGTEPLPPRTDPTPQPKPPAVQGAYDPPAPPDATDAVEGEGGTSADDEAAACAAPCGAADGICTSQATICAVAAAHPLDASFEVDCAWAAQVCQRAQRQCGTCRGVP